MLFCKNVDPFSKRREKEILTKRACLTRIFLFSSFASFLACGVAVKEEEAYQSQEKSTDYQFSLVSNSLYLTPEEEVCVASYPDLKSEYIRDGITISGVTGNSNFSYPNCSETVSENCITTSEFPAAKMDGIASKVALGQTVGGVDGTTAIQTQANCSEGGQSDCIATASYLTMDLSEQGNSGVESLTTANFSTRIVSTTSFEYWDASGNRNVSAGDADLISSNLRSGVDIFGTDGPTDPLNCASISVGGTWIMVPGNPDYGTNDFCVMKYEAKCSLANGKNCTTSMSTESPTSTAASTPWVQINQQDANTECASLGKGFHLITNDEWMTIGSNILNVTSNWSNNAIGSGILKRGHSDDDPSSACEASSDDSLNVVESDCTGKSPANDDYVEQRTHTLSNGEVIWDFGANVMEWTAYFNDYDRPTPVSNSGKEYSTISSTSTMSVSDLVPQDVLDNSWGSSHSIGLFNSGSAASGGSLMRGGDWDNTTSAGIFSAMMFREPIDTRIGIGFRCSVAVP